MPPPDGRDNRKGCAMMFFCGEESLKKKKALQAVAKDCSGSSTGSRYQNQISFRKRISWCTSLKSKGSMTVEAALVFPLFLFGLTALLYLFVLLRVQTRDWTRSYRRWQRAVSRCRCSRWDGKFCNSRSHRRSKGKRVPG